MPGDAFFPNVVLLAHMDGTNGGTTFTDSSSNNFTLTAVSGATTSTSQVKFGTASQNNVAASTVRLPNVAAMNLTGSWTIEMWLYQPTASSMTIIGSDYPTRNEQIQINSGTGIRFYPADTYIAATLPTNTWFHLAMTRSGSTYRAFLNGTSLGTVGGGQAFNLTNGAIGGLGGFGSGGFVGHIDDVRITTAVRYTSNFTAPTAPFPDYGLVISGTVTDDTGANAARTVYAYRRDTGAFMGSTVSNGTTGAYSIPTTYTGEHTIVFLDDDAGTAYNALVLDRITPP